MFCRSLVFSSSVQLTSQHWAAKTCASVEWQMLTLAKNAISQKISSIIIINYYYTMPQTLIALALGRI